MRVAMRMGVKVAERRLDGRRGRIGVSMIVLVRAPMITAAIAGVFVRMIVHARHYSTRSPKPGAASDGA
jgi:hypothetical protein